MRRIKKQFKYTKVTGTNMEGVELLSKNYSGKVDAGKVMKDYLKDNEYTPMELEFDEVTETRVMSAEDFMKYSTLLTDEEADNYTDDDEE